MKNDQVRMIINGEFLLYRLVKFNELTKTLIDFNFNFFWSR